MDNKIKRISLRKQFIKNFEEKDFFSCCDISEKILKSYKKDELQSMEYCTDLYNLAYIQQHLGRYSVCVKYYKKLLKILEKSEYDTNNKDDVERIRFIVDLENALGICNTKSTLKQRMSIKCFDRALSLIRKYLGDKDENVVNVLHNLGCSYYDIQQYEDAIYHFLDELSYRKDKNLDFVDNLNFLGYSYEKLKKYEEAIGYFKQSLDILKGLVGINSEDYIANLYYISSIYYKMERYDLAIKNYEKSCSLIEQKLGDKHPYLAEGLSRLAETYLKLDKINEALKIQLRSLGIVEETVGEKHLFYASSLKRVGDIYYLLENYEKSLYYYEIENKIKKEVLGIYNVEYVNSLLNLINLFIKNNNEDKEKEAKQTLVKMVDFDLDKKSYKKALLILCKIYINNDMASDLYDIYEYYKNVDSIDTFDDMVKRAKEIEEDIINKKGSFDTILEDEEYDMNIEDIKDDIFNGIKNLFDGLQKEIKKIDNKEVKKDDLDDKKDDNM